MSGDRGRLLAGLGTGLVVVIVVGLSVLGGGVPATAATHVPPPTPDCGDGADGGVVYTANSGFRVVDDSNGTIPAGGPFLDGETIVVGDVELRSPAAAGVHLENATAPVCVGSMNTTAAPVDVTVAGDTVRLDGNVDTLAMRDVTYDDGDAGADLAYTASGVGTLTVVDTGLATGTTVEAVDATGAVLDSGSVDDDGSVSVVLPAGNASVDLLAPDPVTTTTTTTPPTTTTTTPPTTTTTTVPTTTVPTTTTTTPPTTTTTTPPTTTTTTPPTTTPPTTTPPTTTTTTVPTATTSETAGASTTDTTAAPTSTTSPPQPGFTVAGALAALVGTILLVRRR